MAVYLNNAATSWPKPQSVASAVYRAILELPHAGQRSNDAQIHTVGLSDIREFVSEYFNSGENDCLIFTSGGTIAINLMIRGFLHPGDHVVTSAAEHNAVLRTLDWLRQKIDLKVTIVPVSETGLVDPYNIVKAIRDNTKAVVLNHVSNVTGAIQDIEGIAALCHHHGLLLLTDGCQSAGHIPVDFSSLGCDAYAFTGHKGLLGPPGTGGLLLKAGLAERMAPLVFGGNGFSAEETPYVSEIPDRFEPGTTNLPGLIGLYEGIKWLQSGAFEHSPIESLGFSLAEELKDIPGVRTCRPDIEQWFPGIVSFEIAGMDSKEVEAFLWEDTQVISRTGYCCAPLIHNYLGTCSSGVVRFSPGHFSTVEDIDIAVEAVKGVCKLAV